MGRGKSDLDTGAKISEAGTDRGQITSHSKAIERGDKQAFARAVVQRNAQLAKSEGLTKAKAETKYRQYVDYDPKRKQFTLHGKNNVYTFDNQMNLIGQRKA